MSNIPKNRDHLLELIETRFAKLWELIEPISEDDGTIYVDDDFSIKDIIALRVWWGDSVVKWIAAGQKGKTMAIPAEGYTWRETPALNRALAEEFDHLTLAAARKKLLATKKRLLKKIAELSDKELEQQGVFDWAGKWPVMRWVSVGSSTQYDGATRLIRKALRAAR